MSIRTRCVMNQRWGGCLSQPLKFNVCSCWSPSAVSLMFGSFPCIWQFISRLLTRSPREGYALSFKETKIPKSVYRRSFLPVSDLALTDILNKDIFTSTELCTPEFLVSQEHSYHSGKHHPRDAAGTSDLTRYGYKKWSLTSSSQRIEQLQHVQSCYQGYEPKVFLMEKYSNFFHKIRYVQGEAFKASQESKHKCFSTKYSSWLQSCTVLLAPSSGEIPISSTLDLS